MITIPDYHWRKNLQPLILQDCLDNGYQDIDDFLNCTHKFTPHNKPNYVIKLYFDNEEYEILFRLKYRIG